MSTLSRVAVRVGRPYQGLACSYIRLSSTTRALNSGSFFNLGGLGASREAQYLSRERGIPRTEYSSNTHLIRSSEVDPFAFAPAPGPTPGVAATRPNFIDSQDTCRETLVTQLQAAREEIAQTQRVMSGLQARGKGLETVVILVSIFFSVLALIGHQVYRDGEEKQAEPWQRLYNLLGIHINHSVPEIHRSTQPHRDATSEQHILAETGLSSSFETHPKTPTSTGRSILSGLFWANN